MEEKLWNRSFIMASITNLLMGSAFNLLMPTIPLYLSEHLNVPQSQIGIVLSSYVLALLIIRPFSGYLVDAYPRKTLFLIGLALFVATFIGYYYVLAVLAFVILRFIHGLFWGLTTVSINTIAIDVIPAQKRSEGIGYFGTTMNIAMAVGPYIAVAVYNSYGFPALITWGLVMGVLAIAMSFFINTPQKPSTQNIGPLSFDRFILIKALPIFYNHLFLSFGFGTIFAFAVIYGQEMGLKNAGTFFLFLALGIILSRINAGKLMDRGYLHQSLIVSIILIIAGYVLFANFGNIYTYCAAAFVLGTGYGILFPGLQTIYINMAPHSKRGTANSTYLMGFDLGIGIGMLTGGYLAEHYSFKGMYYGAALLCVMALILYIFISRRVYDKNKLFVREGGEVKPIEEMEG